MSENTTDPIGEFEMLDTWEGPAEHSPGVLFDLSKSNGMIPGDVDMTELTGWVTHRTLSGVKGDPTDEAIKSMVRTALVAWRHQYGQAKLDELKQNVTARMTACAPNAKLTLEELLQRIDAFFNEIQVEFAESPSSVSANHAAHSDRA